MGMMLAGVQGLQETDGSCKRIGHLDIAKSNMEWNMLHRREPRGKAS